MTYIYLALDKNTLFSARRKRSFLHCITGDRPLASILLAHTCPCPPRWQSLINRVSCILSPLACLPYVHLCTCKKQKERFCSSAAQHKKNLINVVLHEIWTTQSPWLPFLCTLVLLNCTWNAGNSIEETILVPCPRLFPTLKCHRFNVVLAPSISEQLPLILIEL